MHCQKLNTELHNVLLKSTLNSLTIHIDMPKKMNYAFNLSHMIILYQDTKVNSDVLI